MDVLFEPVPIQWGFRGDPYVWAAMRDQLAQIPVPERQGAAVSMLREAFHDLVGLYPETPTEKDFVVREEFNHGGMSGGGVSLKTWRERLLPLLALRAAKAAAGRPWEGDPDDTALLHTI